MRFRIHGSWPDGTEDSFDLEANTIEEVTEAARETVLLRSWTDCWSEQLGE